MGAMEEAELDEAGALLHKVDHAVMDEYLPPYSILGPAPGLMKDKQKPYLYWRDAQTLFSQPTVCWDPPAPPQYLRTITAEALGRPERANWREMDPELDRKLGAETVRRLKPYFS